MTAIAPKPTSSSTLRSLLDASLADRRECDPTFRLEQEVAAARRHMGEARWQQLNAEWDDGIDRELAARMGEIL